MVICKYFLRGRCHFGDKCKNEHAYNENSSILVKKPDIDTSIIIKAVRNDMDKAEKGNQWPLSCYGPFQGKPCFPGFEEKSFEEVRLEIMEAEKNGSFEQYKQLLSQRLHEARLKMLSLQNPTSEAAQILQDIYVSGLEENPKPNVFANTNAFNNSTFQSNSLFNNQSTNNNFTFALPENKSIFGNTATPQINSLFANQNSFTTNKNIFGGGSNMNQIQNSQQNISSYEGAATNVNQGNFTNQPIVKGNLFTQSVQPGINQTPFAANNNPFSNTNQSIFVTGNQSLFTTPATNQPSSFAVPTSNQSSPFAASATNQPSPFAASTTNQPSPFTAPITNQLSPFTASTINQPSPFAAPITNQPSPFAIPTTNQPSPFGTLTTNQTSHFPPPAGNQTTPPFGINTPQLPPYSAINSNSPFSSSAVTNLSYNINPPSYATSISTKSTGGSRVFNNMNTAAEHSKNIFGNVSTNIGFKNRQDDPTIYSKLEHISEEEIKQFTLPLFEFGKIPDKPPTLQMCM